MLGLSRKACTFLESRNDKSTETPNFEKFAVTPFTFDRFLSRDVSVTVLPGGNSPAPDEVTSQPDSESLLIGCRGPAHWEPTNPGRRWKPLSRPTAIQKKEQEAGRGDGGGR